MLWFGLSEHVCRSKAVCLTHDNLMRGKGLGQL